MLNEKGKYIYDPNEKLDMENAPEAQLFEPWFKKIREAIEAKGYGAGWVGKTCNVNNPLSFYHRAKSNEANCPFYEGYWLDGVYGAVKCSCASGPLPGILKDVMCNKVAGDNCPLKNMHSQE